MKDELEDVVSELADKRGIDEEELMEEVEESIAESGDSDTLVADVVGESGENLPAVDDSGVIEKDATEMEPFEEELVDRIYGRVDDLQPDQLRERAIQLKRQAELSYFELGGILWKVNKFGYYEDYGYDSWTEYVQKELDFTRRKAHYLTQIWDTLKVELGVEAEQLEGAGWTNVKEIVDVVDDNNVDEWIGRAKQLTRSELVEEIEEHRSESTSDGEEEESEEEEETPIMKQFALFPEQKENVEKALEVAEEKAASSKTGHLLDNICTFFLANYVDESDVELKQLINRLEENYGVRIIAFHDDALYQGVKEYVEEKK